MQSDWACCESEGLETSLSPVNRSLERGLRILRCFRPGIGALGNYEIAERTGLPRSTVSRLTQTLARNGFLRKNAADQTYRLAFSVLSLALAAVLDFRVVNEARPLMRALGAGKNVNVGLSVPDGLDMVYLHVVHGDRSRRTRRIEPGNRRPMETNAIGHAYLASLDRARRVKLLAHMRQRHPENWRTVDAAIRRAAESVRARGYCSVIWGHGTESTAMPLALDEGCFVVNVSYSVAEYPPKRFSEELAPQLLLLGRQLERRVRAA